MNNKARKEYTLTEVVGILSLIEEGVKVAEISLLTGRSIHSLRYKFFEKATLKGKTSPRSVSQYPTLEDLYKAHDVNFSLEEHQNRVTEFKNKVRKSSNG